MGRPAIDITGQTFGHWHVIKRDGYIYGSCAAFLCKCSCGTIKRLSGSVVRRGETTNCGCVPRAKLGNRARKHGKHQHHLYVTWRAMRERCRSPKHHAWKRYGGRGIKVCSRWDDFSCFLDDMEATWSHGLTLDRINNEGNYEPSNCRWATPAEQAANKGRLVTVGDASLTIRQWAKETGITTNCIRSRISRGWTEERAVSTPL